MSFRYDPLVGIAIFYLAIKSQMLNSSRVVKWLTVVQQHILEFNKYTVNKYILIISEHKSRNCGSPVLLNLSGE
jgi:neutral trehalase